MEVVEKGPVAPFFWLKSMLNPKLNVKKLKRAYASGKRVRVDDFLEAEAANQIRELLAKDNVPMHVAFYVGGQSQTMTLNDFEMRDADQTAPLKTELIELASQGIGYCYESVMPTKIKNREVTLMGYGHDIVKQLAECFNSPQMLKLVKQVTSNNSIIKADAQLTRFRAGHYITRHRDQIPSKRREIAYVLSLTDGWHPDWGGLLQFYDKSGAPKDAWSPRFNSLSLFDIGHIHSVTYVTPFAKVPRYSMTGWFMS
jgi:hypothetical protein